MIYLYLTKKMADYSQIAKDARKKVLELIFNAQTSHIGSNFSCIDILAVLFEKIDLDKDKFILSKGWAAASLYYFLWRKGRITEEELNSYCREGSKFIGLSEPIHPNIPFAGGSMGMGLPAAVGFALSKKLKGKEGKVYVLMSDGEMQCGTTWESVLIAKHHELNNLVVIIDNNGFQAMGKTKEILNIDNISARFCYGFYWSTIYDVDGHDFEALSRAIDHAINGPIVIVVKTIKGKGVSFMEGNNLWHYSQLNKDDYERALIELE